MSDLNNMLEGTKILSLTDANGRAHEFISETEQEKAGFKGLEEALLTGQVLFVAKPHSDVSWLSAYYQNRGKTVEPKVTDEVKTADGETIYLIYQLQ